MSEKTPDYESSYTCADLPLLEGDTSTNDNCLGLDKHAKALANFIANCATPMTIGIQGDWGSGKTSLMNLIRGELGTPALRPESRTCFIPIVFNTWQYSQLSQQDRLPIAMLSNLIRKVNLEAKKLDPKKWPSTEARVFLGRLAKGLARTATVAVGHIATGSIAGAGIAMDMSELVSAFDGDEERVIDADLFEKLYLDFKGLVVQVSAAARATTGMAHCKIVFYIDDLDRLEPSRAIELLEVIKNFLDVPGCVFVLAIDYNVIVRGLIDRKKYKETEISSDEGRSFFDKIIQVPYKMPTDDYSAHDLLARRLIGIYSHLAHRTSFVYSCKLDQRFQLWCKNLLSFSIGNNPRSVKRLLNLIALSAEMAGQIKKGSSTLKVSELDMVTLLTAMQMAYPSAYRFLVQHKHIGEGGVMALCVLEEIVSEPMPDGQENQTSIDESYASWLEDISEESTLRRLLSGSREAKVKFNHGVIDLRRAIRGSGRPEAGVLLRMVSGVPKLANMLLEKINCETSGKQVISDKEIESYLNALTVSLSTEVGTTEKGREGPSGPRNRVLFDQLIANGFLSRDAQLEYVGGPNAPAAPGEVIVAKPVTEGGRQYLDVEFEGERLSLCEATRRVVRRLGMSEADCNVKVAGRERGLWKVVSEGADNERLGKLLMRCKSAMTEKADFMPPLPQGDEDTPDGLVDGGSGPSTAGPD
jgi:hypothetical protein